MYTFITNPNARSGLGLTRWHQVEAVLKEQKIPYQVYFTKYQNHATKLVQELTSDLERHTIIVLGGDGTINEVINGITSLDKVTLGYIPIGSSNDFARGTGLPTDPVKALQNILTPSNYEHLNIGVLEYEQKRRRFAVSSDIGFDAGVCHEVMVSRLKILLNRFRLGKLSYAAVALHRLFTLKPSSMTVVLDGQTHHFEQVFFATGMNLRYEGGGFKFCPHADYQDDRLNIIVISKISKWKVLALLPTAFFGLHTRFKGVHLFTCREAQFISPVPLPVHADGEPVFLKRTLRLFCEPDKLRLIGAPTPKRL